MQNSPQLDWLSTFLSRVAFHTASHPVRTAGAAVVITLLAIVLSAFQLEFQTSRLALLNPQATYNQRWLNFLERFGREDDAVIVVSHPDPTRVASALTSIGQAMEQDAELTGVLYRQSLGKVANKALCLMPANRLHQLLGLLRGLSEAVTATRSGNPVSTAGATAHSAQPGNAPTSNSIASNAQLSNSLTGWLSAIPPMCTGLSELAASIPSEGPLLLEDNGTLGLCLVRMPHLDDEADRAHGVIKRLQQHMQNARTQYPDVDCSLTGMPILEWDEGRASQSDMQAATLLSLGGVALIFIFGFGSWRMPCVAVLCLAIGLIWTVALAALLIGHLNLFSVAFGAIIAGLGIDYAIHLLSRLRTSNDMSRAAGELPQALAEAVGYCGKGIVTGAVTTAAAFAVAVLTPFKGMTELGLICALGTLCCLVVTLAVLPAFIVLQAQYLPAGKRTTWNRWLESFHAKFMQLLDRSNQSNLRYRVPMLISTALVTLYAATQVPKLYYDHNLLNLQADDAPSVRAEHQLTSRSQQSAWFAVSMANSPAAARGLHERFAKLPSVARVEEIGSVLAAGQDAQRLQLASACLDQAKQLATLIPSLPGAALTGAALTNSTPGNGPSVAPANYETALAHETASLPAHVKNLTDSVIAIAAPGQPELADFPAAVRMRMASQDGQTFLLRIFAKEDLWQRENLQQFVRELESVDPRVTGHPVQTWYASGELENSYYQAGIYAMLTVCALLMLDLKSIRLVLLSLIPVSISFIQLCSWLVAMEIPFNAANMIALPLIIGIGIDDGVHIMHDFAHRGPSRFRLSSSTTLAVLLTSLTTMVGFGCMGIADHRGLQSLGIVLLVGVGLCWLHSWFTLPAILSFFGPATSSASDVPAAEVPRAVTPAAEVPHAAEGTVLSAADTAQREPTESMLLSHVPIIFSLPDYPELYLKS